MAVPSSTRVRDQRRVSPASAARRALASLAAAALVVPSAAGTEAAAREEPGVTAAATAPRAGTPAGAAVSPSPARPAGDAPDVHCFLAAAGAGCPADVRAARRLEVEFARFEGGVKDDWLVDLAVDADGHLYAVGVTQSIKNFTYAPGFHADSLAPGCYRDVAGWRPRGAPPDVECSPDPPGNVFVVKYDPGGNSVAFAFLGGSGLDRAGGVAVGPEGDVFVAGTTGSPDFPTTVLAHQRSRRGPEDAFVARLSSDLSTLEFGTYVGGDASETGADVAVGSRGAPTVVGRTASGDLTSAGVPGDDGGGGLTPAGDTTDRVRLDDPAAGRPADRLRESLRGHGETSYQGGGSDGYAARLAPDGESLEWSRYLGGADADAASAVALEEGEWPLRVAGSTRSAGLSTTGGSHAGGRDAFVYTFRLVRKGSVVYVGGSGDERVHDLVVGPGGHPHLAGRTASTGGLATASAPQASAGGGPWDAFVARLASGRDPGLDWATHLGGSGDDRARALAITAGGIPYVTGSTESSDFPVTGDPRDGSLGGGEDAFVARLAGHGGSFEYVSHLGGRGPDRGTAVVADARGIVTVVGLTHPSSGFPTVRSSNRGFPQGEDGFLYRLTPPGLMPTDLALTASGQDTVKAENVASVTLTARNQGDEPADDVVVTGRVARPHTVTGARLRGGGGRCTVASSGREARCAVPRLDTARRARVALEVTPADPPGRRIDVRGDVGSDTREAHPWNDRDSASVAILPRVDLTVDWMEVTQGVQDRRHSIPLTRRKRTYVRVFVDVLRGPDRPDTVRNVSARLHGTSEEGNPLDGSPVAPLRGSYTLRNGGQRQGGSGGVVTFRLPEDWTDREELDLRVEVNPGGGFAEERTAHNNDAETSVTFWRVAPVCIQTYPVRTSSGSPDGNLRDNPQGGRIHRLGETLLPTHRIRLFPNGNNVQEPEVCIRIVCNGPFEFNNNDEDWNKIVFRMWMRDQSSNDPNWCDDRGARTHYAGMIRPGDVSVSTTGMGDGANGQDPEDHFAFVMGRANRGWRDMNRPSGGRTLAHELGHNYGNKHVNCPSSGGNSPDDPNRSYPFNTCQMGPTGPDAFYGFDTREPSEVPGGAGGQVGIPPVHPNSGRTLSDLMSYANSRWPSSYTWMRIWERLRCQGTGQYCSVPPASKTAPAYGRNPPSQPLSLTLEEDEAAGGDGAAAGAAPEADSAGIAAAAAAVPGAGEIRVPPAAVRELEDAIRGDALRRLREAGMRPPRPPEPRWEGELPERVFLVGATFDVRRQQVPFFRVREMKSEWLVEEELRRSLAVPDSTDPDVSLRARLVSEGGDILAIRKVSAVPLSDGAPGRRLVAFAMPEDGEADRIELAHPGDPLAARPVGDDRPDVDIQRPEDDRVDGETLRLTWTVGDVAEPDSALATVQYSPDDGETWTTLADARAGKELAVPVSELPGTEGDDGKVRVISTYWGRSGADTRDDLEVPRKPPRARILTPRRARTYEAGAQIFLEGRARDLEDGYLTGASLSWEVTGRDGVAVTGTGESVSLSPLPSGHYTATLTATDAEGRSATASVKFVVGKGK